jgi:hypothetical protein
VFALLVISFGVLGLPVVAHEGREAGEFTIEIGWRVGACLYRADKPTRNHRYPAQP